MEDNMDLLEGEIDMEGLFDNPDSMAMGDMSCVDFDQDGKPITIPKPLTPFEELHCAEYDKFLVPIFKEKDDAESFNGNGVVVDNYLISAAHVANSKKCKKPLPYLYFLFEGRLEKVDDSMIIHDGRGGEGELVPDKDGIHDDLIVYKLEKKYNSFKLSEKKAEKDMVLMMKPYKFNNGIVANNQTFDCEVVRRYAKEQENSTEYWTNCCTIHILLGSEKGDSGSALFRGETLYGILIRGAIWGNNGRQYDMLDAAYINKIIKKK